MSRLSEELLRANDAYATDFGDKAELALPPARHCALLIHGSIDDVKTGRLRAIEGASVGGAAR